MKDKFRYLPKALQWQAMLRISIGMGFLVLFFAVQFGLRDVCLSFPCILAGSTMIVNGSLLFYNGFKGNFICIQGVCRQMETVGIWKQLRNIYISTELYTLKIPVRHRIRNLNKGDTVIIYLSEKTPAYEQDNGYMVCGYYALEIGKEV
ncbi:hypothetical protein D3Z47_02140 [Lachnospiraceae bacterium]|nr:hypothetical protein [Lachnospiraceae bacterium]